MSDELDDMFGGAETLQKAKQSFEASRPVAPKKPIRRLIVNEKRIDKFTLKRSREVLYPSRCVQIGCNYDAAKRNGLRWPKCSPEVQNELIEVLARHVAEVHNGSEAHIIDEDKIPTSWFGTAHSATEAIEAFSDGWGEQEKEDIRPEARPKTDVRNLNVFDE